MKIMHALVVVLFATLAFGQVTPEGAPLTLTASGDCNDLSSHLLLTTTNTSGKPILAYHITVSAYCRPRNFRQTHDFFYKPVFQPGQSMMIELAPGIDASPEGRKWKQWYTEHTPPATLPLKGQVVYVQFADGTTWGDNPKDVAEFHARRVAMGLYLHQLQASRNLTELQNVIAEPIDLNNQADISRFLIANLEVQMKMLLEKGGGEATVRKTVDGFIANGASRQPLM